MENYMEACGQCPFVLKRRNTLRTVHRTLWLLKLTGYRDVKLISKHWQRAAGQPAANTVKRAKWGSEGRSTDPWTHPSSRPEWPRWSGLVHSGALRSCVSASPVWHFHGKRCLTEEQQREATLLRRTAWSCDWEGNRPHRGWWRSLQQPQTKVWLSPS